MSNVKFKAMIVAVGALLLPSVVDAQVYDSAAIDLGRAYEWCDLSELMPPEGIWEFPDDETTVLIKRLPQSSGQFEIFVIDTADCRLEPGEKIGELQRTADSNKFRLNLFTRRNMGILTDSRICSAELKEGGDAFIMHPRKFKVSLRTMWFLPKFWRSLRISVDDPASKLPYGLTHVYPRATPLSPFYL